MSILGNSIYGSGYNSGIVLSPDSSNPQTGVNHLQSFPVLTAAYAGITSAVVGSFHGAPNSTRRLEFFSNPVPDPSGYGEGQTYLGFTNVTTDGMGNATFTATGLAATTPGQWVSATATAPDGSTSQFAPDVKVTLVQTTTIVTPRFPRLSSAWIR